MAIFGITFAKVAIIALLLALRAPNQKKRGYFLHFLWITNVITAITITALVYTQCRPMKATWDITVSHANCNGRRRAFSFTYVQGSWAAATDIFLAIYPIFVVWSLQTTMRMKLGFCVLMSGGLVYVLEIYHFPFSLRTIPTDIPQHSNKLRPTNILHQKPVPNPRFHAQHSPLHDLGRHRAVAPNHPRLHPAPAPSLRKTLHQSPPRRVARRVQQQRAFESRSTTWHARLDGAEIYDEERFG